MSGSGSSSGSKPGSSSGASSSGSSSGAGSSSGSNDAGADAGPCTAGATQCAGAGTDAGVETCGADGTWGAPVACAADQTCASGACLPGCYRQNPTSLIPPPVTAFNGAGIGDACSSADVANFIAACTGTGDCAGWQEANAPSGTTTTTCGRCILPETSIVLSDGTLLWQPTNWGASYTPPFSERIVPNIGLCVAWLDSANGSTCAAAWDNLINCIDAACSACTSGTENDNCEAYAYQTGCGPLASKYSSACAPDLADGGALNTCVAGGDVTAQYDLVIGQTCGNFLWADGDGGAPDGGSDDGGDGG